MTLLLVFLFLALGVSFVCSVLEAVILSITPSYIAQFKQSKSAQSKYLVSIKENIERPLAAILSLNTIAHTIGAAGVGAQAGRVFGEAYFGIISAVLTLLILIVSEIIPKTLGANFWRQLVPVCLSILRIVEIGMYPLVILSQFITSFLSKKDKESSISRDEIAALAWVGEEEGVLSSEESEVIHSIVHFRSLTAKDIMTPRTVLYSLADHLSCNEIIADDNALPFSRIPIYDLEADKINGFVRKDEVLGRAARGDGNIPLKELKRPLLTVLASKRLLELLRDMTVGHFQLALIVNEYGETQGIATMEDLVETMLGLEIVDETDHHPDMQQLARSLWEKRSKTIK